MIHHGNTTFVHKGNFSPCNKMFTFVVKNFSDVIPARTTRVVVTNKKIKRLPSLPVSLTWLYCSGCISLLELPSLLHCVGLTQLDCYGCTSLRKLPSLPAKLRELHCGGCISLEKFPPLPVGLTLLGCNKCESLCELPPLFHCVGLTSLDCTRCTSLCELPSLPTSLTRLYCAGCTSLSEIPPLPMSLTDLDCDGCTSLLYIPTIPEDCEYHGPPLPTEEEYFEQANVKKNQELKKEGIDKEIKKIIGRDPYHVLKKYFSFAKTRKSKGKGNPKKRRSR
jgi:hypothetical protein